MKAPAAAALLALLLAPSAGGEPPTAPEAPPATPPARLVPVDVPLSLDPAFLRRLLIEQVYTQPGETAEVWSDAIGCNRLVLSSPRVYGRAGRLRVLTDSAARVGTPIGDACHLPVELKHQVEVLLAPEVAPGSTVVRFRVVDSNVLEESGRRLSATGVLWTWVKDYVHPRLGAFEVDLGAPIADLRGVLPHVLSGEDAARTQAVLDSVRLAGARVTDEALVATLRFDVPEPAPRATPSGDETPLTPEERAALRASLERWDAFVTFVIKAAGSDGEAGAARQELRDVLLDARQELVKLLEATESPGAALVPRGEDPVRGLFLSTWARLAPVLRRQTGRLPGETALRWLGFVAAADALAALERIGAGAGVEITADGLRRLARTVAPDAAADPLAYDTAVDPQLREELGFGPPIAPPEPNPAFDGGAAGPEPAAPGGEAPPAETPPAQATPPGDAAPVPPPPAPDAAPPDAGWIDIPWLFVQVRPSAPAPPTDLLRRLNAWLPGRDDLEEYLDAMRDLLREAGESTIAKSDLAPSYHALFRWLVLATAWQESCWRQFVREGGKIGPLTSTAGAVGVMQVNVRVWRGFYDPKGLRQDVGYNARAGADILMHYLEDYAIAKGEHVKTGRDDFLARATYAVYNGGPRHLTRYRKPKTAKSLRRIDDAFWRKYQAVKAGRELDVALCWGG